MAKRLEYATLEWLWDMHELRVNLPQNQEHKSKGTYNEVVAVLTTLGNEGWEAVTCTSGGNWLFWTLKREMF
jgi:hypothetical protein